MISAIVFDFGGVLMRTADPIGRREWEARLNLHPGELERVVHGSSFATQAQAGIITAEHYWQRVAETLGIPESEIPVLRHDFFRDDRLDLALIALIDNLHKKGYKVGLLSNDTTLLELKLRDELNIYDKFDAVMISARSGIMKPALGAYKAIADALNVSCESCVFIDDNLDNVEGARKVGMQVIHYRAGLNVQAALEPILKVNA